MKREMRTNSLAKLSRNLICGLVTLLLVSCAGNGNGPETEMVGQEVLTRIFDSQIAILKDRGTPREIVEMLENQKDVVIEKASEMEMGVGNTPFLPVIPFNFQSLYEQMASVRNYGNTGYYVGLDQSIIYDVVDVPEEPYYIYDVEGGESSYGLLPVREALVIIMKQGRSPLTVPEIIALVANTDVLLWRDVAIFGSRYDTPLEVPVVFLDSDIRPELFLFSLYDNTIDWLGSPSCNSRD